MKIHKAGHIEHTSQANSTVISTIWSIDFHPDGVRLATGGNDYVVNIWDIESIISNDDLDSEEPTKLATLDSHMGSVNCVRWSNMDGKYLASGSDDKLVLIWELNEDSRDDNSSDTSSSERGESWKISKRLVGHSLDVMGVAWSKDNRYLATCGMDSKIIIWQNFESIRVLNLSASVKGISFDPLGEFLASQSDDQKVIIWNTSDWEKHKVQDFQTVKKAGAFFQRLSWSPDGDYLVTSNVMCESSPSVVVLDRSDFETKFVFAGHGEPTEISLFNPRQFIKPSEDGQEERTVCYCSLGGQDRTLTVWDSTLFNPQWAIKGLFLRSINDLSWSASGYHLAACSTDGAVVILEFSEEELGIAMDSIMDKKPTKSVNHQVIIPSTSQQIAFEESARLTLPPKPLGKSQTALEFAPKVNILQPVSQASTVSRVNGKKKVQPLSFGVGNNALKTALSTSLLSTSHSSSIEPEGSVSTTTTNLVPHNPVATSPLKPASVPDPSASFLLTDCKTGVFSADIPEFDSDSKRPSYTQIEHVPLLPYLGLKRVKLDQPMVPARLVKTKSGTASIRIECDNSRLINQKYARLVCYKENQELWEDILSSPAVLIESTERYTAVALTSNDLATYSLSGSKVLPIIHLDSVASLLHIDEEFLLCISSLGMVYLWNMVAKSAVLAGVSAAPLLDITSVDNGRSSTLTISTARIINQKVVIGVSSGKVFTYDSSLMAWVSLHDSLFSLSDYSSLLGDNLPTKHATTQSSSGVSFVQDDSVTRLLKDSELDPSHHRVISVSHLEYQVSASIVLKSSESYKYWLYTLVQRLADDGQEDKLRELCQSLLGPPFNSESSSTILSLEKCTLLKDLLHIIASSNRSLQHLVAEYSDAIEL